MISQDMAVKIDDTMRDVLDVLHRHGYATTGYIVDETGKSRPTITKRLDRLHAAECIEYIHEPTAFWKLNYDPRNSSEL